MAQPPRILLFTGDGKGKTTAALGMVLRALGYGMPTLLLQFVKNYPNTGEIKVFAQMPRIEVMQTGLGFIPQPADPAYVRHRAAAQTGLRLARQTLEAGRHELFVFDEICVAVSKGLLEEAQVLELLTAGRSDTCIVLTGRGATPGLIAAADTVTEMRCVKHGYQAGIKMQKGVEI